MGISCINVHPRFIQGLQHGVIRLFRRGCNIIAQWHSFLFFRAQHLYAVSATLSQDHQSGKHSVLGFSKGHLVIPNGYFPCAGASPPHLDGGTDDPLLTLPYEQAGLLDKPATWSFGHLSMCHRNQGVVGAGLVVDLKVIPVGCGCQGGMVRGLAHVCSTARKT